MAKLTKKPINIISLVIIVGLVVWQAYTQKDDNSNSTQNNNTEISNSKYISVGEARKQQLHDVQAQGAGTVVSLLPDDLEGSRHQRILVRDESGDTLLVVHNIDLAPRINDIRKGDNIEFFGEYIWNEKGGLIHWTHHSPNGNHIGGWIKHNGKRYE